LVLLLPSGGKTLAVLLASAFVLTRHQKVPSAVERYTNEIKRVTGVIDAHLKKTGTPYLVGDKLTYADLSWVPWQNIAHSLLKDWDYKTELPHYAAWIEKLLALPSWTRVQEHPDLKRG
jgi:glutathione S-transferase